MQVPQALRQSIRQLQQQIRRARNREQDFCITSSVRRTMLAIYAETKYSTEAAAQFLQQHVHASAGSRSLADWCVVVEDLVLKTSPEQLANFVLPETQTDKLARVRAKTWLGQRSTALWVREQNYNGIAQASTALLAHFSQAAGSEVVARMGSTDRAGRDFGRRMRKAWGLRLGSLQIQDPISDVDLQAKAGLLADR